MMNQFKYLLHGLLCFCLLGCGGYHQSVVKQEQVGQCNGICMQRYDLCRDNCVDNCHNCTVKAHMRSRHDYLKYLREHAIEGKIVARELNSYRDPLQCRKVTCQCVADLDVCRQSCTGIIRKQLKAVSHCT
jgi:hypothetical protein